jgi:hypothetical protein
MDHTDQLRDLVQDADHAATDAERFAGTAVQYAKDSNFAMFEQTIDAAIAMAESLPHQLRALKTFIAAHPEIIVKVEQVARF